MVSPRLCELSSETLPDRLLCKHFLFGNEIAQIHDEDRGRYEVPVLGDSAILRNMPKVERSRLRYMVDANSTNKGYAKIRLLRSDNQIVM